MKDQRSWPTVESFLSLSNEELGKVDPLVMNLVVAKGIHALSNLDIGHYVRLADQWANDICAHIATQEQDFFSMPERWENNFDYFRLETTFWYIDQILRITYREDIGMQDQYLFTDPNMLFLNGIMDTMRGTCGNMALFHVVLGRRIGLPVFLACVGSHFICRFDDGVNIVNVEATVTGYGYFFTAGDEEILVKFKQSPKAKKCGSDMHSLTPREMLGRFVGLRARHFRNTPHFLESEVDYLLARYLFPENRELFKDQMRLSTQCSTRLFEPNEQGHPFLEAKYMQKIIDESPGMLQPLQVANQRFPQYPEKQQYTNKPEYLEKKERRNVRQIDAIFQNVFAGRDIF